MPDVRLVTPNLAEVCAISGDAGRGSVLTTAQRAGNLLRRRWRAAAVAVTCGAGGAILCHSGPTPLVVPAPTAADGDACVAGVRFAAAAAQALAGGALVSEAVQRAVAAATAYVTAGGPAAVLDRAPHAPEPERIGPADAGRLVAEVRARGGTSWPPVAASTCCMPGTWPPCAARQLGGCLVVCVNSDEPVRGLKGPDRPLTGETDRSRLLAALDCVDAVVVFQEPTPRRCSPGCPPTSGSRARRLRRRRPRTSRGRTGQAVRRADRHRALPGRPLHDAVIVTGGSSGLGAAVFDAVTKVGGRPVVVDRQRPGRNVPWVDCDLADTGAAEQATRRAIETASGGLDGVVTAAGMDVPGALADLPRETWERIVMVDLLAMAAVVRSALPALERSHGGVVTVASTLGVKAVGDATAYCATKFGVVGFTRALAAELAGRVNVTLLVPGGMRTRFFDDRDERCKPGPDAVLNDPAHVANAVLFALSQPRGCAVREMIIAAETETSYP